LFQHCHKSYLNSEASGAKTNAAVDDDEDTPTVSAQINLENQEEEELAQAVLARSLNKYFLGNQWRSFMVGCTLAFWISVVSCCVIM